MSPIPVALALTAVAGCWGGDSAGTCTPTTCAAQGKTCGEIDDGCGHALPCGTCAVAGETCGGGGIPNVCGAGTCTPRDCAEQGKNCGLISDGCAAVVDCGGCTSPETCGGGGVENVCGGGPAPDAPPGGDGSPANAPPTILQLSTNVATLLSDQQLVVTAVVGDPDGLGDLAGGTLLDPIGGGTYGTFVASGSPGAYTLSLSWSAIDAVGAIDAPVAGVQRTFRAQFFDLVGHQTTRDVAVTLRCATSGETACSGACYDLATDPDHCGTCTRTVPSGLVCRDGAPACPTTAEALCGTTCALLASSYEHCGDCGTSCRTFESTHGLSSGTSSCDAGRCLTERRIYSTSGSTSCQAVCGAVGLTCATTYSGGTENVGWASYRSTSCQFSVVVTSCTQAVAATFSPQSGWCGYGSQIPFENLVCTCSEPAAACTSGPESTVAACTDGCSNDGDAWADCDDYNCCDVVTCPLGTSCNP